MLEAVAQVQAYTRGMDLESFEANDVVVDAVLYRISVIGEAARAIPDNIKTQHTTIAWRSVQGMRNRLVHEYFGVRVETVWQTVESDLPDLAHQLEMLLRDAEE